jgi:hypothetical protein
MRREHFFWLLLGAVALLLVEATSFVAVSLLQLQARSERVAGIFWDRVRFSDSEIDEVFAERDDLLGWPTAGQLESFRFDADGARPSPAFPAGHSACVAAFGDSFTYGQEASDEDAWGNRLAETLGCRVANFGVPGYGVDQAYLRYGRKADALAPASVVVVGFFPENIMRHVNQYVGFRVGRGNLLFKPRFVLEDEGLRLVPPIAREQLDQQALNDAPETLLPYEFFVPGSAYGPVPVRFPYTLTAARALLHPRVLATITGRPNWDDFYATDPRTSDGLDLTNALLAAFVRDVEKSGKRGLVFVFTNADAIESFLRDGSWPYQPALDFMTREGIPFLHVGPKLAETFGPDGVCRVFTRSKMFGCTGHYTKEGYAIVAEMIAERLLADGFAAPRARASTALRTGSR